MPIIVDYSGISIANLFANGLAAGGDVDEGMLRHMILSQIKAVFVKHRQKYGDLIIAYDAGGNWRKDSYPNYKACRKTNRDGDSKDWDVIFESLNKIKNEIQTIMPYRHIQVRGCEADDIIGVLVHEVYGQTDEPTLIVSSDKDFKQLQMYKNVRQYAVREKKFIDERDPKAFLFEQILRGDKSDGVPNVLSDDDVFVDGRRQTPVMQKKIVEWSKLNEPELIAELGHNYIRNRDMIDLTKTPAEHVATIIKYHADKTAIPDGSQVLNYFIEARLKNLMGSINDFIYNPSNTNQNDTKETTTNRLFT
jgi:hypothetical protein